MLSLSCATVQATSRSSGPPATLVVPAVRAEPWSSSCECTRPRWPLLPQWSLSFASSWSETVMLTDDRSGTSPGWPSTLSAPSPWSARQPFPHGERRNSAEVAGPTRHATWRQVLLSWPDPRTVRTPTDGAQEAGRPVWPPSAVLEVTPSMRAETAHTYRRRGRPGGVPVLNAVEHVRGRWSSASAARLSRGTSPFPVGPRVPPRECLARVRATWPRMMPRSDSVPRSATA